jgi:hypothetical protein
MKLYLYEGLNTQDRASVMLWESAGRKLVEAQLTADQITQLFQQIQTAKGNRTLVGKGVDAGSAVKKAYDDLVSKVQNSGPMKNADALYDQAAAKLKQATGGDQGAMAYVQKYRDFAKKHPVAQSFIYGALIAAAGITGAGAGGAAALGLFKMVDKLLQGEKFSTALGQGLKTGALAYGASKLGDLIKNTIDPGTGTGQIILGDGSTSANIADGKIVGDIMIKGQIYQPGDPGYKDALKVMTDYAKQNHLLGSVADMDKFNTQQVRSVGLGGDMSDFKESRDLTRAQVLALFERVARLNSRMLSEGRLEEGIWDDIKSGASKGLQGVKNLAGKAVGAVAQGAAKVGRSMTANVSSDALTKAWQAAGSPTDSAEIEKLLQAQGVNPEVIKTVFQANSIPVSVAAAASTGSAGVDANEPMPDVMSTNRAETPAAAVPATAGTGPGAQVAQQQAQQAPQQTTQQPTATTSVEPTAAAQQAAPAITPAAPATQSKLPDISRLTALQKQQLLKQIDQRLASMPAPKTKPAAKTATPTATQQPSLAGTQFGKNVQQKATAQKISAPANPGAPTLAEQAKLQQKLQAATAQ